MLCAIVMNNKIYKSKPYTTFVEASREADILNEMFPENNYKVRDYFSLCTNKDGLKNRQLVEAHRILKAYGYVFFLDLQEDAPARWGICARSERKETMETGYTFSHAFHKLGKGDAREGVKLYHSW